MSRSFFLAIFLTVVLNLSGQSLSPTGWKYIDDNDHEQQVKLKNVLKGLKHGSDMMLIDGGTFSTLTTGLTMENVAWINPADTALVIEPYSYRTTVKPFYLSNHEVTNFEYRDFVKWVIDSIADAHPENPAYCYYEDNEFTYKRIYNTNKILYNNVKIYPDTLCWNRPNQPYNYAFNVNHLNDLYFNHRVFDNYPVVGVNWYQAMAYCTWKTIRLKKEALKKNKTITSVFRLPTKSEWEYASSVRKKKVRGNSFEIEYDNYLPLWDKKGKLRTNIVTITDKNGFTIYKNPQNNFTAHVRSYPCNYYKLYHIRGNVSEWILNDPRELKFLYFNPVLQGDTLEYYNGIAKKLQPLTDKSEKMELVTTMLNETNRKLTGQFLNNENEEFKQLETQRYVLYQMRIELIFKDSDLRIVKGGSWEDGVIYQQNGVSEYLNANTMRRNTGFRVAMSM